MDTTSATGLIRIVNVPAGQAPEEIRKAWVGIILPCEPILGFSTGSECEVITGKRVRNRFCFHVPQIPAIEALEQKVPEAAKWWRARGYPQNSMWFTFAENEATIIYGVVRQVLTRIDDLEPGDNDRFFP